MHALPLMVGALCVLTIAYRFYSKFIAAKVLALDDLRRTPAHTLNDGQNYHPTNKYVLFGHHFAAITGAGPLVGPVLAAQFGFLPGYLWILVGVVVAGAVHDFVILAASMRRGGKSLAEIARTEVGPLSGALTSLAILFIVVVALAGLGVVVRNALAESPWGTFTIAASIPIALFMGVYLYVFRKGKIAEATAIGVVALLFCLWLGGQFGTPDHADHWANKAFSLTPHTIVLGMAAYGFAASVLPVWLLLCPRDYLSSFLKIGTILALVVGVIVVNPKIEMAPVTAYAATGGPVTYGKLFPFMFIIIACGAISGFHGLVGSGTTPKMIDRESDARFIGYGAMLMEGLVGITALITAVIIPSNDYFGMNVNPALFAKFGIDATHLKAVAELVGEKTLEGRAGGGPTLAVGMTQIFSSLPGMTTLAGYLYHFAVMFEALFILTTIDTGTRVARFLVQEFAGRFHPQFGKTDWLPGTIVSTAIVVACWGGLLWNGAIDSIWPMFGIANQLLAATALCIATTILFNEGRTRYVWVTIVPATILLTTTLSAGAASIAGHPKFLHPSELFGEPDAARMAQLGSFWRGLMNSTITVILMTCVIVVAIDSVSKWIARTRKPAPAAGATATA
ncbi:MAG TPA: carbon starvation CstA family protein [bacterium]|nr:carbon starvation CstA family protein [bacterium]